MLKLLKLFNTNNRILKKYERIIENINLMEKEISIKTDDEILTEFLWLKEEIKKDKNKSLNDIKERVFALIREGAKRSLGMRHYDVQLIGGLVLNDGAIAEMKTGEGKTLVATLPAILNSIVSSVHIVTVNDYLAKRDAEIMKPLYDFFQISVGVITEETQDLKSENYNKDIVYGTNSEFGFDYLKDNMVERDILVNQKRHWFAIVDEVDSILIDEARTPLIISGGSSLEISDYKKINDFVLTLKEEDYDLDFKNQTALMKDTRITKAELYFNFENLYDLENAKIAHGIENSIKANFLMSNEVEYLNKDSEILIIDEFTGRIEEGRRFSTGLHQAIEAKENVEIQPETETIAKITYQNYFRLYEKLSGMTGTAQTEAAEFHQIYKLDVISIPTNKPLIRKDKDDLLFMTEEAKYNEVFNKIIELNQKGQPVLIGTGSVEKSEKLGKFLESKKLQHNILNAKNHEKEAEIILNAGKKGAITVATNMAGRGVDIKISDEVKELGGLYIIGTERHDSRRIDNQLRGRSGRQGDPGISQFYLSLDDNLLLHFGGEKLKSIIKRLGTKEDEVIESRIFGNSIEKAQKKIEQIHFESRKHTLEYDDILNNQRNLLYKQRKLFIQRFHFSHVDEKELEENKFLKKIEEYRIYFIKDLLANDLSFYEGMTADELNKEKLNEYFKKEFNVELSDLEDIKLHHYIEVINWLENIFETILSHRTQLLKTNEEKIMFMKNTSLPVIDDYWIQHMVQIDNLSEGINLRSYNQKDPLNEFKRDAYKLFQEFIHNLKINIIKRIYNVAVVPKNEENNI